MDVSCNPQRLRIYVSIVDDHCSNSFTEHTFDRPFLADDDSAMSD